MDLNVRQFAEVLKRSIDGALARVYDKTFQRGVITAVSTRKASVQLEGNTTAYPNILCIGSYRPVVGDKVLVLSIGNTGTNFLILGRIDTTASQYTDANGWVVYDNGSWKQYRYTFSYNVTVTNGQRANIINNLAPPVGETNTSLVYNPTTYGGFSGHIVAGVESAGSNIQVNLGNQYSGGSLNFVGTCHIIATKI